MNKQNIRKQPKYTEKGNCGGFCNLFSYISPKDWLQQNKKSKCERIIQISFSSLLRSSILFEFINNSFDLNHINESNHRNNRRNKKPIASNRENEKHKKKQQDIYWSVWNCLVYCFVIAPQCILYAWRVRSFECIMPIFFAMQRRRSVFENDFFLSSKEIRKRMILLYNMLYTQIQWLPLEQKYISSINFE